jgi:hypothetical protein
VSDAAKAIHALVADIRRQIHVAEDAGADHLDLCVAFPAGFIAMSHGWPFIEVEREDEEPLVVAVVPKVWARERAEEALAETSWAPPPPGPGSSQMGLWGFSQGVGGKR